MVIKFENIQQVGLSRRMPRGLQFDQRRKLNSKRVGNEFSDFACLL